MLVLCVEGEFEATKGVESKLINELCMYNYGLKAYHKHLLELVACFIPWEELMLFEISGSANT